MPLPVPALLTHCTTLAAWQQIARDQAIKSPVWSVDASDAEAVSWALSHTYDRHGARHQFVILTFSVENARTWNIGHLPWRRVKFYECFLDIPVSAIVQVQLLRHYIAGRDPQIQAPAAVIPARRPLVVRQRQTTSPSHELGW